MKPTQHFFLSFASSIFAGIVAALLVFFVQDWISDRGLHPSIVMLVAFIIAHTITRWYFRTFVRVECIFGCGKKAYALPGRSDRFRCEQCGNDM